MSGSSKFDLSSLERSGSFRENMENTLLSSLPNMTRTSSSVTQGDALNFFQCVRIDPKSMVVDHKLNRPAEFNRLASSAVGIPVEDTLPASSKGKQPSTPSLEDLRRLKSGVRESGTKARERVKIFNDCLSVINKCFPAIPSRKRSRLDALSNDRSNRLQNHASTNGFELEQQKFEERTKNPIPNKRTRTSMMDVRGNNPRRPSGSVDKDRGIVRLSNSGAVLGDDRSLSMAVDGWENSKMKKKRTGIKIDSAASSMMTKPVDGYREHKQGMHMGLPTESRSRLIDAHGFRSDTNNGGQGVGKAEATPQTSSGMRSSVSRTDSDNTSVLHERRERPIGQDKERVNLKAVNKANSRDFSSSSPSSAQKLSANVRAPRSGSIGGVSELPKDWDVSDCTDKIPVGVGANSRKRTPSARSSRPVANWVQRPQKTSRTARRTNLLDIIPSNDESPAVGTTSNMMSERCFPANSPQQVKVKSHNFSPAAVSECEKSGAVEIKSRDENMKCDDIDELSGQNVQKMSTLLLPPRKNKTLNGGDHGDGIRRQGRSGRDFTSSGSPSLSVEKPRNVGTTKQIRSSRHGHDKTESRLGRPPTRNFPGRKAYTRQKHTNISGGSAFHVGSDDGHEELLAAANAVTNTDQALSSLFWKEMEPAFRFISEVDLSYIKDQINSGLAVDTLAPAPLDAGSCTLLPNGCGFNEFGTEEIEPRSVELSPEHLAPIANSSNNISMHQRLLAALIHEEGNQGPSSGGKEDCEYDASGSHFEIEKDMDTDILCSQISPSSDPFGYPVSNGYGVNSSGKSLYEMEHNTEPLPGTGIPSCDNLQFGLHTDPLIPDTVCSDSQYCNLSIDERLLMELNSIGIDPDSASEEDEVSRDINRLEEKYRDQVSRNKSMLEELLNSASEAKEQQEKEFEVRALDKLVENAYKKYMSFWGPSANGTKSASFKMAKQAALALVNRTMELYQEFKITKKSCFDDSLYKDIFISGVSNLVDGHPFNSSTKNKTPVLVGTQQNPMPNNQHTYSSEQRLKRKEVSLDDIGGTSKNKVERKTKQKNTHSSRKMGDQVFSGIASGSGVSINRNEQSTEVLEELIDLSGLQLPEMDELGVAADLGGQGEDIGDWFNMEDDGLHDHDDFMSGLGIPMDDLSDLNMM